MTSRWLGGLAACTVAIVLAIGADPRPAAAQQVDIAAAQKRFQDLYAAGDYAAALAEAQKTEAAAKRGGTNNMHLRAGAERPRPRPPGARQLRQRRRHVQPGARAPCRRTSRPTIRASARSMANLATVYLLQGRYADAEKLYKQALDIGDQGVRAGRVPRSSRSLAISPTSPSSRRATTRPRSSTSRRSIWRRRPSGPDSLQVALVLNNLTKVYEEQSRFDEVEDGEQARARHSRAGARSQPSRGGRQPQQSRPRLRAARPLRPGRRAVPARHRDLGEETRAEASQPRHGAAQSGERLCRRGAARRGGGALQARARHPGRGVRPEPPGSGGPAQQSGADLRDPGPL